MHLCRTSMKALAHLSRMDSNTDVMRSEVAAPLTPRGAARSNSPDRGSDVSAKSGKDDNKVSSTKDDFQSVLRDVSSDSDSDGDGDAKSKKRDDRDRMQQDPAATVVAPIEIAVPRKEILPLALSIPQTTLNTISLNTVDLAQDASHVDSTEVAGTDAEELLPASKPEPIAASDMIDTTAQGPAKGDLAFAAKLNLNGTSAAAETAPHEPVNPKAAAPAPKPITMLRPEANAADSDRSRPISPIDPASKPVTTFLQETYTPHTAPATRVEHASPLNIVNASARLEQVIETRSVPTQSASDIIVRIADSERGTDVRFVERAGEVHVSVRTSDSTMAQTLRGGLSDFTSRLEQGGIKAEMWRPGSENSNNSSSQDQTGRKGDQRNAQREREAMAQEDANRDSKKPKWVEAMELSIGRQS